MKIFKQYKFLNRFAKLPRDVFSKSIHLGLSVQELDIICKMQNFAIGNNEITPNLTTLSERAGTSIRTFQRSLSSLKDKEYIELKQNKTKEGKFTTNTYNFGGLFKKIDSFSNQLYIDFDCNRIFGAKSSSLGNCSFISVPKTLDFFQKKLNITSKENLFLKYLIGYMNDNGVSEISLNITSKTTPLTRSILQKVIKDLQKKELIIIKERFSVKTKKRLKNRYDLKPLFQKLNDLERVKVEQKLKEKGIWKDFNKKRSHHTIKIKEPSREKIKSTFEIRERIAFLNNEIFRLQPQLTSKYGEIADKIREYQIEINELKHSSIEKNSISYLMKKRMESMKKKTSNENYSEISYKAKRICDKLNGNWERSYNLYIKAVKLFPNSVERFVGHALERGKRKENYFATCISKEFKKLELK